jgi:hypothetical protein
MRVLQMLGAPSQLTRVSVSQIGQCLMTVVSMAGPVFQRASGAMQISHQSATSVPSMQPVTLAAYVSARRIGRQ